MAAAPDSETAGTFSVDLDGLFQAWSQLRPFVEALGAEVGRLGEIDVADKFGFENGASVDGFSICDIAAQWDQFVHGVSGDTSQPGMITAAQDLYQMLQWFHSNLFNTWLVLAGADGIVDEMFSPAAPRTHPVRIGGPRAL